MSHEIEATDSVAYFGAKPWHGIGAEMPERMAPLEAMEFAGLDWEVDQLPVYCDIMTADGVSKVEVPGRVCNVRRDTSHPIAIVSDKYKVIQNVAMFEFLDALVGGGAKVEVCGSLRKGARVWATAKIGSEVQIKGDDTVQPYLLTTMGHDRKLGFKSLCTDVRTVCANTLRAALEGADKDRTFSFTHVGDVMKQIEAAQNVIGLVLTQHATMVEGWRAMAAKQVTGAEATGYFAALFPDDKESHRKTVVARGIRELLAHNFEAGVGSALAGRTAWGLYNAATEWTSHQRVPGSDRASSEKRFESLLLGGIADKTDARASTLALGLAGVN